MQQPDVIVAGKGNAALCAALEARHAGAQLVMLEAASEDESGGMMRFAYDGVEDLRKGTTVLFRKSRLQSASIHLQQHVELINHRELIISGRARLRIAVIAQHIVQRGNDRGACFWQVTSSIASKPARA